MLNTFPLSLGIVVIGRNEGQRLVDCLASLPKDLPIVYVDSGSTDHSVAHAKEIGATVVELDMSRPFTAARARNEGVTALKAKAPGLEAVQFLDGDTILDPDWLRLATDFLVAHPEVVAVAGRRREKYPDASWYNTLCDIEWNTPIGEAAAVGGDALYLLDAFEKVGGFNPRVIAGEEPELCFRLRQEGGKVFRLNAEMTQHDAAIHTFPAWWKRGERSGYAFTLGALMHGQGAERYNVRPTLRALFWGGALPLLFVLAVLLAQPIIALLVLALYGAKWIKMRRRFAGSLEKPGKYALFLMILNMAEAKGSLSCLWDRLRNKDMQIIEYK